MLAALTMTEFGSLVAIVIGYVLCFCLWFFIFRKGGDEDS
jgi:hypothetical protein